MTDLRARVRAGERLDDLLIVDAHAHMGPWCAFHVPHGDAAGMVHTMDRIGVRACVASAHAAIGPDYLLGNETIAQAAVAHPGRIFGYITVNPNYARADMRQELERCFATGRFVGVKLHPDLHAYPADGPNYRPAWEFAHEHALPLLSHAGEGSAFNAMRHFDGHARDYPRVKVLIGHALNSRETLDAAAELAARRPNVYLDITGSPLSYGALEQAVEKVGAGRVIFGTDMPFLDPRPQLGRVAFAQIPDADKVRILGRNAAELFNLPAA